MTQLLELKTKLKKAITPHEKGVAIKKGKEAGGGM